MAKEVSITVLCDKHSDIGEKVTDAQTYTLGVDGKWLSIDLCATCATAHLDPMQSLLLKHGVSVDPPTRPKVSTTARRGREPSSSRDELCLWCEADYAGLGGLMAHVRRIHRLEGRQADVFGTVCPLDGQQDIAMLGRHTHTHHNGMTITQAFREARKLGDPHGVVAVILAKAGKP